MNKHIEIRSTSIIDVKDFIDTQLKPNLPYSLPLLRRCQFHINQNATFSQAEIWIAEAIQTKEKPTTTQHAHRWIAAHIDLSNAGQTQVWAFASWEAEFSSLEDVQHAARASADFPVFQALFEALRGRMRKHHIPKLPVHTPPQSWQVLKDAGKRVSEPYSRSKVLFGTAAEVLWPHLEATDRQAVTRTDMSYYKYIVASRRQALLALAEPPAGFHFEKMRKHHLQTMIDRTDIPRSMQTIQQLPNIALYNEDDMPVAWGLLSKDASIGSLHTEPEYRRRGLAELTARRLMAEQVRLFDNNSVDNTDAEAVIWSHADVADSNIPSQRVMEKIGGKRMWRCGWIEVDIGEDQRSE